MIVGGILEHFFINHKFWQEEFIMFPIGELDLFLIIGPFFSIGVLLIRFLPEGALGKFFLVFILSGIATGIEFVAIEMEFLIFNIEKWGFLNSLVAYYLGLMSGLGFYYAYYSF